MNRIYPQHRIRQDALNRCSVISLPFVCAPITLYWFGSITTPSTTRLHTLERLARCIRQDTGVVVLTLTTIQNLRIATIFVDEGEQTGSDMLQE